jgi:hypothetical protein
MADAIKPIPVMAPDEVGHVLAKLPVHFRLEAGLEDDYVWVLVEHDQSTSPRVFMDDMLEGVHVYWQSDDGARALDRGQFLRKDWSARGCEDTLERAVAALAAAAAARYPDDAFAEWWVDFVSLHPRDSAREKEIERRRRVGGKTGRALRAELKKENAKIRRR